MWMIFYKLSITDCEYFFIHLKLIIPPVFLLLGKWWLVTVTGNDVTKSLRTTDLNHIEVRRKAMRVLRSPLVDVTFLQYDKNAY